MKKGLAAKEISIDGDVTTTMLFMKFCVMGIVEKIAFNENYISYKLGQTKEEFFEFAFKQLFRLVKNPAAIPEEPQEQLENPPASSKKR